ncbi:DUF4870 domain-containing protein [Silanimonas lenta]|uniref:DUF4870 domain-containing protein n=1 Tax=Silanimonas lenta TaxID=265429 RepID=UPI00048FECC8|nr:DUF4870 domain-containing protein [Silanimonas lenta]
MSDAFSPPPAPGNPSGDSDQRTMAMLAHLSAILFSFLGPLLIWLIHKDQADKGLVVDQAKEALNFSLTVFILLVTCMIISATIGWIPVIGWLIAIMLFLFMAAIGLVALVLLIMAAIKANEGQYYRYPFALRLVK